MTLNVDPRLLGFFDEARRRRLKPGRYQIRVGSSAAALGQHGEARLHGN